MPKLNDVFYLKDDYNNPFTRLEHNKPYYFIRLNTADNNYYYLSEIKIETKNQAKSLAAFESHIHKDYLKNNADIIRQRLGVI